MLAIRCPTCTSPDVAEEGAGFRCRACGGRFVAHAAHAAHAAPDAPSAPPPAGVRLADVVLVGGLALALLGLAVWLRARPEPLAYRHALKPAVDALVEAGGPPEPTHATGPALAPAVSSAAAVAAPTAELVGVHEATTSIGGVYWLARYRNTGTLPIERPSAVVSLFDNQGARVALQQGWSEIDVVPPGQEVSVLVLIAKPPPRPWRAEVAPGEAAVASRALHPVEIAEHRVTADGRGFEVVGTVRNPGATPLRFVRVVASGLDAAGHLAAVGSSFVPCKALDAGATCGFRVEVNTWKRTEPATWEVVGQGRP